MIRILENRGMATRSNISLAILSGIFLYGLLEFWYAYTGGNDPTAYFFSAIFIGGAFYGLTTTRTETRNLVIRFEADPESGRAEITLWRPFGARKIETTLDKLTGWRLWVNTARGLKAYFLLAGEPSYDGTLQFALQRGMVIPEILRELAPEAIEDFERETGVRRDED